jgi:hypothetical protein
MANNHTKFTELVSKFMAILGDEEALAANYGINHLQLSKDEIYGRMETMKDYLFGGEEIPEDFPPILDNIKTELKNFVEEHSEEEDLESIFIDMMNDVVDEFRPVRARPQQLGGRRRRSHRRRRASHRRRNTRMVRRRRTTHRR